MDANTSCRNTDAYVVGVCFIGAKCSILHFGDSDLYSELEYGSTLSVQPLSLARKT